MAGDDEGNVCQWNWNDKLGHIKFCFSSHRNKWFGLCSSARRQSQGQAMMSYIIIIIIIADIVWLPNQLKFALKSLFIFILYNFRRGKLLTDNNNSNTDSPFSDQFNSANATPTQFHTKFIAKLFPWLSIHISCSVRVVLSPFAIIIYLLSVSQRIIFHKFLQFDVLQRRRRRWRFSSQNEITHRHRRNIPNMEVIYLAHASASTWNRVWS